MITSAPRSVGRDAIQATRRKECEWPARCGGSGIFAGIREKEANGFRPFCTKSLESLQTNGAPKLSLRQVNWLFAMEILLPPNHYSSRASRSSAASEIAKT